MSEQTRETRQMAWQIILIHSLQGALCPLIPVPFLDDYILGKFERRMNTALFALHNIPLDDKAQDIMSDDPTGFFKGVLGSIVNMVVLAPLKFIAKKIVNKVLFVKACTDVCSKFIHEGWLIQYALETELMSAEDLQNDFEGTLARLRAAILHTCDDLETSPIFMVVQRLFKLRFDDLAKVGKDIAERVTQKEDLEKDLNRKDFAKRERLDWFFDEILSSISAEENYLSEIGEKLTHNYKNPPQTH